MSGYLNPGHMLTKMQTLDIKLRISMALKDRNLTLRQLSQQMGKSHHFLAASLRRKEMNLSLLLTLCHHLQVNLLEPYFRFIPPELQKTVREKALEQQLATLQQQYNDLQKERDIIKELAMK